MDKEKVEKIIKDMGISFEHSYQKRLTLIFMTNYNQKYLCVHRGLGYITNKKGKMKNE